MINYGITYIYIIKSMDIDVFNKFKEIAPLYKNSKFSIQDKALLYLSSILTEQINKYSFRFNFDDIQYLLRTEVSNEVAITYDKRFSGSEIVSLAKAGISNEVANGYDKRLWI